MRVCAMEVWRKVSAEASSSGRRQGKASRSRSRPPPRPLCPAINPLGKDRLDPVKPRAHARKLCSLAGKQKRNRGCVSAAPRVTLGAARKAAFRAGGILGGDGHAERVAFGGPCCKVWAISASGAYCALKRIGARSERDSKRLGRLWPRADRIWTEAVSAPARIILGRLFQHQMHVRPANQSRLSRRRRGPSACQSIRPSGTKNGPQAKVNRGFRRLCNGNWWDLAGLEILDQF